MFYYTSSESLVSRAKLLVGSQLFRLQQQAVVMDGSVSSLTLVISGVPQGTVLGPILFLIHILDIAEGLSKGTTATSFDDFNADKFECFRIWPNPSNVPTHDYLGPAGEVIEVKHSPKDLGVHLSSDLTFKLQVEKL